MDPTSGNVNLFASVGAPFGLNFTPGGDLTVGSFYEGIYRFDIAGTQLSVIPGYSNTDSQVDPQNNVWTTSLFYGQVAKYDTAGNSLLSRIRPTLPAVWP